MGWSIFNRKRDIIFYSKAHLEVMGRELKAEVLTVPADEAAQNKALGDFKRFSFLSEKQSDGKLKQINTRGLSSEGILAAIKKMVGPSTCPRAKLDKILAENGGQKMQATVTLELENNYRYKGQQVMFFGRLSTALFSREENFLKYYSIQMIYGFSTMIKGKTHYFKFNGDTKQLEEITNDEANEIIDKVNKIQEEFTPLDLTATKGHDALSNMLFLEAKVKELIGVRPIVMGGEQTFIKTEHCSTVYDMQEFACVSNTEKVKFNPQLVRKHEKEKSSAEKAQEKAKIKLAQDVVVQYHASKKLDAGKSKNTTGDQRWTFIIVIESFFEKIKTKLFNTRKYNAADVTSGDAGAKRKLERDIYPSPVAVARSVSNDIPPAESSATSINKYIPRNLMM